VRVTKALLIAVALPLAGCDVVHDMRSEYVANRSLVDAQTELRAASPSRDLVLEKLDLAFRLGESDPELLGRLAEAYLWIGEWEKALRCYEAAPKSDPLEQKLRVGYCELKLGHAAEGERALDEALAEGRGRFPREAAPLRYAVLANQVGYSFADANVRLDDALALIEEAVEIDPLNAATIDSLGWAYYRLGDIEKAAFHLERAARLMLPAPPVPPGAAAARDPEVMWHLGAVHARLRQYRRAERELTAALRMHPSNEEARRALQGLQLELPLPAEV